MSPPGPFLLLFFGIPSFAASAKASSLEDLKGIGAPGGAGGRGGCDNDIFCDVLLPRRDIRLQSGERCEDELSTVSRGGFGMLLKWGLFLLLLLLFVIVFAFLDHECVCVCVCVCVYFLLCGRLFSMPAELTTVHDPLSLSLSLG